jgi:hypothetical protein
MLSSLSVDTFITIEYILYSTAKRDLKLMTLILKTSIYRLQRQYGFGPYKHA